MINFENSDISNIVIHHVGNKFEGGGLTLSDGCFLPEDPDVVNLLKSYFLSAFKKDAYYNFLPYEEELMNNPVYASVSQIFDNESEFYQQSVQIAEHLFEQSNNPISNPENCISFIFEIVMLKKVSVMLSAFSNQKPKTLF